MPKVSMYNMQGKQVGDIELNDNIFGIEVNEVVLKDAIVNYLANQRQGTQSTKTRSEVRGGGRKPWKQKGTGRARQGSIRAPQWVGGGVAFGPKPRSYKYALPRKVKRLAMKSALSSKVASSEILVLDKLELTEIKTKNMIEVLNNLNVNTKTLIVLDEKNENVERSTKNIPNVKLTKVNTLNVYDIINCEKFIITKDAVSKVEEVYV